MTKRDDPLVTWIRAQGTAERLLAEHSADRDGRCKSCSAGRDSSGKAKAPCTTYQAALVARREGPL